jgi:imidazolonepropionase-like amidohydrolase
MRPVAVVLMTLSLLAVSGLAVGWGPPGLTTAPYEPDSGDLDVYCSRLVDGLSDEAGSSLWIGIRGGRFTRIGPTRAAGQSVPVLDLSGHTCLPGLIEMHAHILESFEELVDLKLYYGYTLEDYLEAGRRYARITLEKGFTTVRNVGSYYGWSGRALREEIRRGEVLGPRLQVAGFYLTVPGGGGDLLEVGGDEALIPAHLRLGVSRSVEEFRRNAQAAVEGGADLLKVIASGAVLAYGGDPPEPEMTPEQLAAVVAVADAAGLPVAAHAHGAQSIRDAILAGVDTIEHATYIDAEGIRLAIEHDVALIMDVGAGDWMIEAGPDQGWVEEFQRKLIEVTTVQRENFRLAHEAGATIAHGTDLSLYPYEMAGLQFAYMVEWGMSPMEAIKSATSVAARFMRWQDRVGAIEIGRFGDLVAVRGDPLADISLLESVDVVVKGGSLIRARSGAAQPGRAADSAGGTSGR